MKTSCADIDIGYEVQGLEPIPVVILTGGLGTRIGGNKAVRMLSGKTLLERSLEQSATYSGKIAIAANRSSQLPLRDGLETLTDATDNAGPNSGLSSAFDFAAKHDAEFVLIIPCDTPFLPHDLVARLYESIGDCNAALAASGDRVHAACSLWRTDAAEVLPDYLALGRRALFGFAETIGYTSVLWATEPFDPFFNINNEGDLAHAEEILAKA
jgi:molybdenum cofactor guanylyltransferase